jgi:hypothetical protein
VKQFTITSRFVRPCRLTRASLGTPRSHRPTVDGNANKRVEAPGECPNVLPETRGLRFRELGGHIENIGKHSDNLPELVGVDGPQNLRQDQSVLHSTYRYSRYRAER